MPLEVYGSPRSPKVNIFYSPVIELVCAVHLLTDPAHHQYEIKWAEEMLSILDEEELEALQSIKHYPAGGIEFLNYVLETRELFNIENFIDYIANSDEIDFFFYLLNENIDKEKIMML